MMMLLPPHLHICVPYRDKKSFREQLGVLEETLQRETRDAETVQRLNVLYFNMSSALSAPITASVGETSAASKTLFNHTLQTSDLCVEDRQVYDYLRSEMCGKRFGTEDQLRERIREFVSSRSGSCKVLILDHADRLSASLQSEMREYTGRPNPKVRFVFVTYPETKRIK